MDAHYSVIYIFWIARGQHQTCKHITCTA